MKWTLLVLVACSAAPQRAATPRPKPPPKRVVPPPAAETYEQLRHSHDPEPRTRAAALMATACDRDNDAKACSLLGDELASGAFIDRDPARAARVRDKACAAGQADACYTLADQYGHGTGVPLDATRMSKYLAAGCELHHARSCFDLGELSGPKDLQQKAFDLRASACDRGDGVACDDALRMFQHTPLQGDETALWAKLRSTLEAGCDRGDGALCTRLAAYTDLGFQHRTSDKDKARVLRERACELGDPEGCNDAASWEPDDDKRRSLVDKACKLGRALSCTFIGLETKDPARARELFQRACELGDVTGCGRANEPLRACKLGDAYACVGLGHDEEKAFHYDEAADFYDRACNGDVQLIWDGCGGELRVLAVSCDAGDTDNCTRAATRRQTLSRQTREIAEYACCSAGAKIPTSPTMALLMLRDAIKRRDTPAVRALIDPKHGMTVRIVSVRFDENGEADSTARKKTLRANTIDVADLDGLMSFLPDRVSCLDPQASVAACRVFEGGFVAAYTVTIYGGRPYVTSIDESSH